MSEYKRIIKNDSLGLNAWNTKCSSKWLGMASNLWSFSINGTLFRDQSFAGWLAFHFIHISHFFFPPAHSIHTHTHRDRDYSFSICNMQCELLPSAWLPSWKSTAFGAHTSSSHIDHYNVSRADDRTHSFVKPRVRQTKRHRIYFT